MRKIFSRLTPNQTALFLRRVNGAFVIFWIAMTPVSYLMGWLDSVTYVSALSLWALVTGHLSAWQSGRVEVKQEEQNNNKPV